MANTSTNSPASEPKSSKPEDPRATTLNYEYKEQPPVKANLTPSELEFLENDNSQMGSSRASTPPGEKRDPNNDRFLASVLVLTTFGLAFIFLNAVCISQHGMIVGFILPFIIGIFGTLIHEWDRIHGCVTLSRKLRPVLNMSSVFATYRNLDPDSVVLIPADNYKFAACNVPELNSDLPRTADEKSPPSSPPKNSKTTTPMTSPMEQKSDGEKVIKIQFEQQSDKEY
uniref:Uncharacterized protein n=1 Tax=Panagrolaimus sp. JU765 TaxID=591449 RepID=A0AC34QVC7_9BILA